MPPTHALRPSVGITRVVSMPTVVVLPAPFGPSRPKISPLVHRRSRFSTARSGPPRPSKTLVSPLGDDDAVAGVVEVAGSGLGVDRHRSMLRLRGGVQ